jgi:tetratricopeptide (TPR) repeat protein
VPRQLPSSVPHFTGRTAELTRLTELMEEATAQGMSAILVISGMAGAGKTALAVHWAHQVAGQFPSGQLHVNLRGYGPSEKPAAPTQVVRWFLDALGVVKERIPAALDAQAGLYRSLLAGKRMLVVLDNARDEAQVRSLLPGSAGCLVIVTSRNQMPGLAAADGAQLLMLDVLADDDAADLLAARLGLRRVAAEPAALAEIASLCGRLPLALAIAAARAAGRPAHPLTVLAAELRQASDRLDALDAGEATASTRAVFSWSYVQLSAAAARMFRLLGIHPGPDINAAAAVSLAGISPRQTRSALRELTAASLLAEYLPGRYMFHDLLRCYASELACSADSDDDRREAIWRTFDHYLHTANALLAGGWRALELTAAQPRVTPEAIARHDDLAWFEAEHKIMLRLIDLAAADGLGSLPWQLAWTVAGFFDRRGYWHDWAAAQYTALAAARRADDRAGQARACHSLGQACIQLGRYGDGYRHLRRALFLYRQLEYREGQAHVHICRGVAAFRQHRYPEALAAAPQALDLLGSADRSDLRAIVLNEVGYGYAIKGDYNEALFWCAQARDLYHELGARFGEADAWDSMAQTHQRLGHYSQAIDCYQRAQRLHSGNRYAYGQTSLRLGDAYQAAGNVAAARDAWQQALTTFDDLHHADAKLVRAKLHSPRQL